MSGEQAFPKHYQANIGMTLRDYFAAAALPGIFYAAATLGIAWPTSKVAEEAFKTADAMLAARK